MLNGAAVSLTSQLHSTVDDSTTSAELTEAYLASNDIVGFRNIMTEMGFVIEEPTVLYQDNEPAIQIAERDRNLASKTKHMLIRTWKIRERLDDQEVHLVHCGTTDMFADLGTKALGPVPFIYLRDQISGYALVLAMYPNYLQETAQLHDGSSPSQAPSRKRRVLGDEGERETRKKQVRWKEPIS